MVGFDDIPIASFTNPPLTTVQQDTSKAGEMLVTNLLKMINSEAITTNTLLPELIVRGSTYIN